MPIGDVIKQKQLFSIPLCAESLDRLVHFAIIHSIAPPQLADGDHAPDEK